MAREFNNINYNHREWYLSETITCRWRGYSANTHGSSWADIQRNHRLAVSRWIFIIISWKLIHNKANVSTIPEEIFKSQKALWGSNDGSMLLYATFNDTNVGQMMYPWFSSNPLIQSGKAIKFHGWQPTRLRLLPRRWSDEQRIVPGIT